jgi:hypothetical protein
MNTNCKQLIRAEIEQRKGCFVRIDDCKEKYLTEAEKLSVVVKWNEYIEEQYDSLLAFIDSLPEEKPSKDLEEAAEEYANSIAQFDFQRICCKDDFIAGAQWQAKQMPMPNSTELIAMWSEEEAMLKEKDFRGDEWRLAQNAFLDGFAKGTTIDYPMPEDTVIFQKGVEEGKRLMMEDAVELGTVDIYWEPDGDRAFPTFDPPVEDLLMPGIISQRFEDGDKVKVIIVKEDEQ